MKLNFQCFFIEFCKRIENTLFEYKKRNNFEYLYIICPSQISSLISLYFKTLSKCKYCKFIDVNVNTLDNQLINILPKNFKQIIVMDYISQHDDITLLEQIVKQLRNLNTTINSNNNKLLIANNLILNNFNNKINNATKLNSDTILDDDFVDDKNIDIVLDNIFLNLYDFVNESSIAILHNYDKNKNQLIFITINI